MLMYATVYASEWQEAFRTHGIKAGEVEGCTGEPPRDVVWVQHRPFPGGSLLPVGEPNRYCPSKVVEIEVPLSDVFIDLDDFDLDVPLDWRYTLEELDKCRETGTDISWGRYSEAELADAMLYGAYVKQIKPEQIKSVRDAQWTDTEDWVMSAER